MASSRSTDMPFSPRSIWTNRLWRVLTTTAAVTLLAAPGHATDDTFEQASAGFVQSYIQAWSGPTGPALAYMDQVYPSHALFYGKDLSHAALMALKRRFAARWPERDMAVRPGTIKAVCDPNHLCTVRAIYDWHYRSPEREAASSGSARLELQLQDGITIVSEDGSTIPGGETVSASKQSGQAADLSPARQAPAPSVTPAAPPPAAIAGTSAQQEGADPEWQRTDPPPADVDALRADYAEHGTDAKWITAWLEQKRAFSGEAIVADSTEEHASGSAGAVRTTGFTSAAGTIACINPDDANALKPGEKVNLHGVITIFIDDVMYLEGCSIQPG